MSVIYDGRFDLAAEIQEITAPLAARIVSEPSPTVYLSAVEDLSSSVNGAMRTIAKLLAELDAVHKVARIPLENRRRATDRLVALADLPAEPVIINGDLPFGRWATVLVDQTAPIAQPLAACLGRAMPPGAPILQCELPLDSISGQVEAVLREIDRAAISLDRRLDRAVSFREQNPPRARPSALITETEARAELAELGVEL